MVSNEYDAIADELFSAPAQPSPAPSPSSSAVPSSPAEPGDAGGDGYEGILAEERNLQRQAIQQSMFVAAGTEPDRKAKVLELAKRSNIPAAIVERNYDAVAKRMDAAGIDYDEIIDQTPGLARWIENPDNAALAKDDLSALSRVEQTFKDHSLLSTMYRSMESGISSMFGGMARIPALAYDTAAIPQNLVAKYADMPGLETRSPEWLRNSPVAKFFDENAQAWKTPEMDLSITEEIKRGNYSRAGMALAAQFAANAPQQAAIIAGTLAGYGVPTLIGAGVTTAADANKQAQVSGVDPVTATGNALAKGTIEAAFERLGTFGILKKWEGAIASQWGKQVSREVFKDFGKTLAYSVAAEGNEEAMTSLAQDLTDYITGVNPKALEGLGQRALDAGILGGAMGGGMTAPAAIGAGLERGSKIRESTLARDFFMALGNSVEATKLKKRMPEAKQKLIEEITAGGPVENIFIPVEAVEAYFQSAKINPTQAMQELGVMDSYNTAKEIGGDVKIPLSIWVSRVGGEHYQGLANDIKFSPTALTLNEAKAEAEQIRAEMEAQAKEAQAQPSDPDMKQASEKAANIADLVTEQLKAAGMPEADARTNARIYESAFKTLGERTGQDPLALFERYGLTIGRGQEQAGAGQVLEQGKVIKMALPDGTETKVLKNPTPKQAESLFNSSKSSAVRYFAADDGNLYVWDAFDLGHSDAMEQLGIEDSPDAYAGAGMFHSAADAREIASRFQKKSSQGQMLEQSALANREMAPAFYSRLQQTVEQKMGGSATPEQINGMLREIKPEERKWSGLDEFLAGKEKVSKEELLEFLRENQLQIQEVTKGTPTPVNLGGRVEEDPRGTWAIVYDRGGREGGFATRELAEIQLQRSQADANAPDTKFSQYTLPGGENYREVLFTLPEKQQESQQVELPKDPAKWETRKDQVTGTMTVYELRVGDENVMIMQNPEAKIDRVFKPTGSIAIREHLQYPFHGSFEAAVQDLEQAIQKSKSEKPNPDSYRSSHWDEPNVLAHVRLNDRTDADGKRVLFVEEIQSDWHQAGRKRGYKGEGNDLPPGYKLAVDEEKKTPEFRHQVIDPEGRIAGMGPTPEAAIADFNRVSVKDAKVPDAPFKKTWHEFAFKKILRMAAEGGYDRVAWTTGEQQAERYDLSKQIDEVSAKKRKDGTYDVSVAKDGSKVLDKKGVPADQVSDLIGKEVAEKAIAKADKYEGKWGTLSGLDLKVGGEGMKGFYDKILVDFANKFGKKFGAKVGETSLKETSSGTEFTIEENGDGEWEILDKSGNPAFDPVDSEAAAREVVSQYSRTSDGPKISVHSLDITPALRDSVLYEGMTLFQDKAPKPLPEINVDPSFFDTSDPQGDAEMPRLNAEDLKLIGAEDKPVIVKANVAKKNHESHPEIPGQEDIRILQEALYGATHLIQSKPATKPNYWTFVSKMPGKSSQSVIEISAEKDRYEVVNWYRISDRQLKQIEKRAEREGGRILITERANSQGAAGLSALPPGSSNIPESGTKGSGQEGSHNQGDSAGARGRIQLGRGGINIQLLENADPSTFLHETGHFYLEVLGDLASAPDAPSQIREDYQRILDWFGVKDRSEIRREHHEQWARGFEAYLMEGKAPSQALREAFARFKVWLISVYRQLRNLDVKLTPEVRDVMNRLLATDDEIAAAQAELKIEPLFVDPKKMGMTDQQSYRYLNAVHYAREAAKEQLTSKLMADYDRAKKSFWKEERAKLIPEIEAEVKRQPVYAALLALRDGRLPDGSEIPGGAPPKLSRELVEAHYGKEMAKRLPKGVMKRKHLGGGIHPDIAASLYGFQSGQKLLDALAGAPSIDEAVAQIADQRMQAKYPDLLTSDKLSEEAIQAVHNESRAELLRMELEHLAVNDTAVLKDATRRVVRRMPSEKEIRAQAHRIVAAIAVKELKPHLYLQAERRAAKLAGELLTQGDINGAFEAKRKELLAHELYRAAVEARESVAEGLEFFKKLTQPDEKLAKSRDIDLVNTARAILAEVGIGKKDKPAASYVEAIRKYDPETFDTVQALLDAVAGINMHYSQVSFDNFVELHEVVKALWDLARNTKQIEIDGKHHELDEAVAILMDRMEDVAKPGKRAGFERAVKPIDRAKRYLGGWRASGRRIESWISAIDGARDEAGQYGGVFRKFIWNPVADATTRYRQARLATIEKLVKILKGIELGPREIEAPELGYTFGSKAELLHAILHSGNESNLSKLLVGRGWGAKDADGNVDTSRWNRFIERMWAEGVLTKADYDVAQQVWDLFEELKPDAQRAHRKMYGRYFNEVTANEIATPFGNFRGGYVPATTDPFLTQDQAVRQEREALEKNNNSFMFPTTGRGFTKSRVEAYTAPLALDIRQLPMHLDKVLRFIHIEPTVKQVGRVIMDRGFRKALEELDPTAGSDMLVPWLQRAAQQSVETPSKGWGGKGLDFVFRGLRRNTGLNLMALNVTNALQQATGLSIAAVKVKPRHLRNALWQYVRQPAQSAEWVAEKSAFMDTRTSKQAIEIQGELHNLILNPNQAEKAIEFARKNAHVLQRMMQNVVDIAVWMGAYDQAQEQGLSEKESVRAADSAVRETQGSMNPEDQSRLATGTPVIRAFTMFWDYFNMQANLLGTEFTKIARDVGLKKGAPRALYVYTMVFLIPAVICDLIVKAMGGGLDEDDDDQYLDDFMESFFFGQLRGATAMFPVVGPVIQSGINGYNNKWYDDRLSSSPAVSALESVGRVAAGRTFIDAFGSGGNQKRAIRDSLTTIGLLTGIPAAPIARSVGYLMDVSAGKAKPSGPIDYARGLVTGKKKE